ncbi:hypothetical protein AWP88_04920 [Escherichia coli]|nr:hypothetical protein AWP61_05220 [Escherichia coli]OKW96187.1 hypothetical protein AWP88_04920 [Escherichia coli]
MTSLKTSIKTITYLSDTGCLEIQGASLLIAFRMMRYAIAAMQNHLDAGYKTLPMVVLLLFYHGIESPYPYSLCWLDCFADPKLARQLYASAFPLIDVTVMPDDEIMQHRRMALLELIQKHIRQRDLGDAANLLI